MSTTAVNSAKTPLRVLIIEDYEEDAMLLERQLARAGYAVEALRIETERQLVDALGQREPWHLVLADYTVPSFGAREALALLQQSGADLPFIIVSGTIDEVSAVDAMRAGAHDYVLKGHLERLLPAIERELSDARRRQQRLRTEAELRVAQQRFSETFNQAAVGMAHTSPEGRFLLVNQRLAEMLCTSVERLVQLREQDFFLFSERDLGEGERTALLAGEQSNYRVDRTLVRSDGSTFPAQVTVSLLRQDGEATATILSVIEDISARRTAERETADLMKRLINSERLAAAGRMANTLAHEINNPLEALTNIFYLLGTHDLPAHSRELVEIASREIERVGHITRSNLSFYRKVPGRTLDLRKLLDEVVQLFQSRAAQYKVVLRTRFRPGIENLHYDPSLRQVFANLVGNALEAMETSGGQITVRARLQGGFALVTVADNGHGIDSANMHSVFEPFFTTKGERGTGLGLWVTRGIVEEQGGRLQLRSSTKGKQHGTTIRITLPAPGAQGATAEAHATAALS